jgi:hypothetical protein
MTSPTPAPDPPAPDDASDLALGLAQLRLRVKAAVTPARAAVALLVSADLLAELFRQHDALAAELKGALARCEGLAERVAQQSELLSRRAERPG